ncbi:putative transcriptional regulator [Caldisphaera lagunensis DSM 15908]|uniref:Putative transcriptional regulator n=1 Tax=Caldisphaera lagunensis (strain DSM 15908 / JCM 11604 / ANMR 0165 / IC-154) TaxID=1056495 RepID=L0A9G5_CALLD|nr:helix-turn-helix domain-containing protein [Caldisphaera lagunensis]AFZ70511.1 putative transcriptional regulator [Caldisphaera lagunensis DSM 15908]
MSENREEVIERLRKSLDLTLYEAKLYLALLEGAKDPKDASAKSGVPLPRIYDVIKVLEAKGMAVSDPKGWYRAVHPRAVAVSAIARLEEDSKKKIKEILNIADSLESFAISENNESIIIVKGYYNLLSLLAENMKDTDIAYITTSRVLNNWEESLKPLVKSIIMLVNEIRIFVEEFNEFNKGLNEEGKEMRILTKIYKPILYDLISSKKSYIIILKGPEGLISVVNQGQLEAREVFDRLNLIWKLTP